MQADFLKICQLCTPSISLNIWSCATNDTVKRIFSSSRYFLYILFFYKSFSSSRKSSSKFITKRKISENSYLISFTLRIQLSDQMEIDEKYLCKVARTHQALPGPTTVINGILIHFPMYKKLVFIKIYFFLHFFEVIRPRCLQNSASGEGLDPLSTRHLGRITSKK